LFSCADFEQDAGRTWQPVSADAFQSCMNGIPGEAQTALADGTILRDVWTSDAGQNWHKLAVPGTACYPRSLQTLATSPRTASPRLSRDG